MMIIIANINDANKKIINNAVPNYNAINVTNNVTKSVSGNSAGSQLVNGTYPENL
ncbi:MAG: hypothetical protein GXP08_01890 [Gammaproteobacteria bacterium]|nr:hypothetical protein [Gammaproteobacteria bacterium]